MIPVESQDNRDQLISATIAAMSGINSIRTDLWYDRHLITYMVITVSDPTGRRETSMTDQSLRAAGRAFGVLMADVGGREALRALGVLGPTPGPAVLCVLAGTTLAEAQESHPDLGGMPVVVIDTEHQRVARLDFRHTPGEQSVKVGPDCQMGAIVDMVAAMDGDPDLSLLGLRGAEIHGLASA